ncbi:hypothetical protein KIPB_002107, partial [Kipferlia bialata]|eukprot:g2107.t1
MVVVTKTSLAKKFDAIDTDGDGTLSLQEATDCLRHFFGDDFPLSSVC